MVKCNIFFGNNFFKKISPPFSKWFLFFVGIAFVCFTVFNVFFCRYLQLAFVHFTILLDWIISFLHFFLLIFYSINMNDCHQWQAQYIYEWKMKGKKKQKQKNNTQPNNKWSSLDQTAGVMILGLVELKLWQWIWFILFIFFPLSVYSERFEELF